jgi:hypothetical protein
MREGGLRHRRSVCAIRTLRNMRREAPKARGVVGAIGA